MNELNHIRLILHQGHLVGDEAANYKEGNINSLVLRSHNIFWESHDHSEEALLSCAYKHEKQHSLVEEGLKCALSKQLCKQQHSQLPLGYAIDVQCCRDRRRGDGRSSYGIRPHPPPQLVHSPMYTRRSMTPLNSRGSETPSTHSSGHRIQYYTLRTLSSYLLGKLASATALVCTDKSCESVWFNL